PEMGKIFDNKKIEAAGGEAAYKALAGDALTRVLALASQESFRKVAILPAILLLVFGAIWLHDKSKGGYKPVRIGDRAPKVFFGSCCPTRRPGWSLRSCTSPGHSFRDGMIHAVS